MPRVTFDNGDHLFLQSVRTSVNACFQTNWLKKTGNWKLYLKAMVLIPLGIAIYIWLLPGNYSWLAGVLLSRK